MCIRSPGPFDLGVPLWVGDHPRDAAEGWFCTFHAADEGGRYGARASTLRRLWSAAKLFAEHVEP